MSADLGWRGNLHRKVFVAVIEVFGIGAGLWPVTLPLGRVGEFLCHAPEFAFFLRAFLERVRRSLVQLTSPSRARLTSAADSSSLLSRTLRAVALASRATASPLTRFFGFDFAVGIADSVLVFESGMLFSFPGPQFHNSTGAFLRGGLRNSSCCGDDS